MRYGIKSVIGYRPTMEDDTFIYHDNNFFIFSVLDGHGGYQVVHFVKEKLKYIKDIFLYNEPNLKQNLTDFFLNLDKEISQFKQFDRIGTTLIMSIFYKNYLYIINIGDSFLIYRSPEKIFFTKDHKPDNPIEKRRILKTSYIINNRVKGILNISRTLGDFHLKTRINLHQNPVIAKPDITQIQNSDKSWILLASDGVWLKKNNLTNLIDDMLCFVSEPQKICDLLVHFFNKEEYGDNITIIFILQDKIVDKHHQKELIKLKEMIKNNVKKKIITYHHIDKEYDDIVNKCIYKFNIILLFRVLKPIIISELYSEVINTRKNN